MAGAGGGAVSGKQVFTEVALVQQHRESIRREMAMSEKEGDRPFEPNYGRFQPISAKIGHDIPVTDRDRQALGEMKAKVEALSKPPQAKSKSGLPERAADEIGWMWQEAFKKDSPWLDKRLPKKTCDETLFATAYVKLQPDGRGPFNTAIGAAKGGNS